MPTKSTSGKGNVSNLIPVINPSTEEVIAEVPDGGPKAVDEAVARARASFESGVWRNKPGSEKSRILWRFCDILERDQEELVATESRNTGAGLVPCHFVIQLVSDLVRYCSGWCTKIYGISNDVRMTGGIVGTTSRFHAYTLKEPVGVAGLIVPWNGPLYTALSKVGPALAAGCSCVLKPASATPLTALQLPAMLKEAGVPDGVVNVVTGYGETTGTALINHPDVDKISFTGSVEVGKKIVAAAPGNLKRVLLELGGKSPAIIFDDADMPSALFGAAIGAMANSGQGCVDATRVYAQRGVYDQVVEGLAQVVKGFPMGSPDEEGSFLGPIISEKQLKKILGYIDGAKREGAQAVIGGHRLDRRGYFVEPTVLTNVRQDSRCVCEEIFGPVVCVIPFDDEEEAVALANDSTYGLAGAVWTKDCSRAHRIASQIRSGMIWVNCEMVADPSMPFGGYKQSGWGLEYGWAGVDAYLNTKTVFTWLEG